MESLLQDLKYAVRLLVRNRLSSAVALVTLALGIGATTAIFCIGDAALVRPLPYDKPEQLFRLGLWRADRPESTQAPSLDDMDQWRSLRHVFSHVGSSRGERRVVVSGGEPEAVTVELVTGDYLPMYGARPILGRAFGPDDERLGAPAVALLGYRYWQTRFNGDPGVLGRTIQFSNDAATIVGVLPDDESRVQTRIFMPLQATAERRSARQYAVYARLNGGVTVAQAQREVDALFARLGSERPQYAGYNTRLTSQYEFVTRTARTTINILLGAVGLVLLIACVNVASLQLARGSTRRTELAVRASVGAGRGRLIRQMLTESLLLSLGGAVLGAGVAWLTLDVLVANVPVNIPSAVTVRLNARVLAATAALAAFCGVLFGVLPAIRLSNTDLNSVLGRGSRGIRTTLSRTAGGTLVGVEIALAILLLVGSLLMIRSFTRLAQTPLGFTPARFLTLEVTPVDDRADVFGPYYTSLLARIRAIPGVVSAGGTNNLPLGGSMSFSQISTSRGRAGAIVQQVTPGYFETAGVPLVAGRLPSGPDAGDPSWILLGEGAARRLFASEPAVGQQVQYDDVWRDVIGVVGDVEARGPERSLQDPQIYVSYRPAAWTARSLAGRSGGQPMVILVAAAAGQRGTVAAALRDAAKTIGPSVIVRRVREGREWWGDSVVTPRQRTVLLGILGGLGLVLALVGVFAVTSFAVSRRVSEIGVRMALGALPGQVVRAVVRDAMLPIAAGIAAGLIGAYFVTRVIGVFLYKTEPRDPIAFAAAALLLAACGLAAAWLPARRAAAIDPAIALRE